MDRTRWSWRFGSLFGIEIRVHVTLLALLGWIIIASPLHSGSFAMGVVEIGTVIAVFATVVLHELAHALVARRFGTQTTDILLLPIGGVANMDHMPARPSHELLVAVAGPTLNIGLALVLAVALTATGNERWPSEVAGLQMFAARLLWLNLALAVFNLIPAFPMDGGRILRALLAMRVGFPRATQLAAKIGTVVAIAFVVIGLAFNPMLALIGMFVWVLARQELATVTRPAAA